MIINVFGNETKRLIFNYIQREYFSFRYSFELLLTINININRLLKQQYAKDK